MHVDEPRRSRVPHGMRALASPRYRRVWLGAFVSNIGTWVATVAVGIYVTELTGKATWTGIVGAVGLLPGVILSPLGGALADRFPRKALLITATTVEAICSATLAVLIANHHAPPIVVTLLVLANGAAGVISWPTYSAILPELVEPDDLPSAVALSTAQWNLGRVIGPAVAGVAIAFAGYTWAFALDAVSFLAVIIAVAPIRIPRPGPPEHSFFRSIRAGLAFIRRDRGIRNGLTLFGINTFLAAPFIALIPAVAFKVFHNESPGTSILVTAQGIGAVVMAVSLGTLTHRFGLRRFLTLVCGLLPIALAAYALSPNLVVAAATILVLGSVYLGTFTGAFTIAQTRAPRALRGRVLSFYTATLSLLFPLGAFAQGWLGDRIGLPRTTLIAAGALVVAYALFALVQRGFLPGLDTPVAPGAPGAAAEGEPPVEVIPD